MTIRNLLTLAETYSAHTSLKLSTIGVYALNDGKFFLRLQDGAGCTVRTAERAAQWFSDNWPADVAWPRDVARPPKTKKEAA